MRNKCSPAMQDSGSAVPTSEHDHRYIDLADYRPENINENHTRYKQGITICPQSNAQTPGNSDNQKEPAVNTSKDNIICKRADVGDEDDGDDDDDEKKYTCGYGVFRPLAMQMCNNAKVMLVGLCAFAAVQSFVCNGINNVNVTSYERRFALSSSKVGVIASAYDVSAGLMVIPISFYGTRGHKPRMLSIAVAVLGLGSFVMAMPHFITGLYKWGQDDPQVCLAKQDVNSTSDLSSCSLESSQSNLPNYLYALSFGMLLHGIAGTTLYTVGTSCLDDNISTETSPVFIAIMYMFAAIGPAIGYVLGGQLLNVYVDFDQIDTSRLALTPEDPRWVGAWWVGFCISFTLSAFVCVMLFGFPKHLPGYKSIEMSRVSQAHQDGGESKANQTNFGKRFRDLPAAALIIIRNPTFTLTSLAGALEGMLVAGFATFLPKFIISQYNQTAAMGSILAGGLAVPGAAAGQMLGGYICRRLNLHVRGMLRLCVCTGILAALSTTVIWAGCDQPKLAGVNTDYFNTSVPLLDVEMSAECNQECDCALDHYKPLCDNQQMEYFSPCFAGCIHHREEHGETVYSNCTCIQTRNKNSSSYLDGIPSSPAPPWREFRVGKCQYTCHLMYVFLPFVFFVILFTFTAATPTTCVILRCVPHAQKTFGLGLYFVFARFLGTVPGPVLFGLIFDVACKLWQTRCNMQTSCWIYDNQELRINLFFLSVSVKGLATVFYLLASICYKSPPNEVEKVIVATIPTETKIKSATDETKHTTDDTRNTTEGTTNITEEKPKRLETNPSTDSGIVLVADDSLLNGHRTNSVSQSPGEMKTNFGIQQTVL